MGKALLPATLLPSTSLCRSASKEQLGDCRDELRMGRSLQKIPAFSRTDGSWPESCHHDDSLRSRVAIYKIIALDAADLFRHSKVYSVSFDVCRKEAPYK